jgi:hypothetical protein
MLTNRLDRIIGDLEKLQNDADEILNFHVDQLRQSKGVDWSTAGKERPADQGKCHASWGVTKYQEVFEPAGSTINRVKALRQLRDKVAGTAA